MNKIEKLIAVALAEVGTVEGPKENQTKYGAFTKANYLPWCGSFVMWCANKAKIELPNCVSTPNGASAFMKMKQWQDAATAKPEQGDIVFFDFPDDGVDRISHVGIVIKDNGDGTVSTIEGNTSPDKKGNQRNGGEVCEKIRAYKLKNRKALQKSLPVSIVGFGKPLL